jgi:septum formation protein
MPPSQNPKLILASGSPRRKMLLEQIGIIPDKIIHPDIDETIAPLEKPIHFAKRLAYEKACKALTGGKGLVLAADTIVSMGNRILGKAENIEKARRFLELLSGRRHQVITAIALAKPTGQVSSRVVTTSVTFKRLTPDKIEPYIQSNEWQGKAGGYAIQGLAGRFVKRINGSYTNVVGLPLFEVANLLEGAGYTLMEVGDHA